MDLSVIENDPKAVKDYLQNFVPINYYSVLGDAYLHQVRAVLLHSVSHAELYNPVYAGLINDLTVTVGKNYASVNTQIEVVVDRFSALARKTETVEAQAANALASITEIQQASASQNKAQATVNQRLEASLKDIVVGGRNLMTNSNFVKGYNVWRESLVTTHDHYIGSMTKVTSTGIVGSLMGIYPLEAYQNMSLIEGNEYSVSFYAYGSITLLDEIYLISPLGAPIKLPSVVISTDLSQRRHMTFRAPIGGGGLALILGATVTQLGDWFSINKIKVELGNKPTDWTPAPEDTDGYIAEVQSTIDTFKEVQIERNLATATSMEKLDSRVKDNAASILTEKNTRTDQFSALSQSNTELVSKTDKNAASLTQLDQTFTDKYNAHTSRLTTLEAENTLGKGKIENLESVTTSLEEVVVKQGSTLSAKLDGLTIGGRNLLRNSSFELGADVWGTANIEYSKSAFGNLTKVTNTGTVSDYFGLTPFLVFQDIKMVLGKEYTLSFYAKGNIPLINDIWIKGTGELPQQLTDVSITEGMSDRYSITFTSGFSTETGSLVIGASNYPLNSWFAVAGVKVEQGNKATDWTEAPEDSKELIKAVEASIETERKVRVAQNLAVTTDITNMRASVGDNTSAITRETTARVDADLALNVLFTGLESKFENNSANVTKELKTLTDADSALVADVSRLTTKTDLTNTEIVNIKSAVSDNSKSIVTAKEELTSSYNQAISNLEIGGKNLLLNSGEKVNSSDYPIASYVLTESLKEGETVTVTLYGELGKDRNGFYLYNSGGMVDLARLVYISQGVYRTTFSWIVGESSNSFLQLYQLTHLGTSASIISRIKLERGNKATDWSAAPEDMGNYVNSELTKISTLIDSKANVSRVDSIENNINQSLVSAKQELTSGYTSAIEEVRVIGENDAQLKANKALADANLDATNKANAAEKVAKDYTDSEVIILNKVIESKASISRVDEIENNANLSLATAKTELTGSYTSAITTAKNESATNALSVAKAEAASALVSANSNTLNKANAAQLAAETYALAQADAKATAALDAAKSDATTKANKAKADAELAAALDAKNKADKALTDAKLDSTAKANEAERLAKAYADTQVASLSTVVNSKASITSLEKVVNDANQALATAKTELTSNYSKAINDIEIGGRNLLPRSGNFTLGQAGVELKEGKNALRFSGDTRIFDRVGLEPNTKYIYTAMCLFSSDTNINEVAPIHYQVGNGDNTMGGLLKRPAHNELVPANKWTKVSLSFETNGLNNSYFIPFIYLLPGGTTVWISDFKLEKGNKPTGWSPAPEDVEADYNAKISTESTARSNAISSVTNLITTLDTDYNGNKSTVNNSLSALSSADTALTNSINSLTTKVGNNTTNISQEVTARSSADTALGNRITTVEGKTDNALARIGTVETISASNTQSIAQTKTDLTANYKQAIADMEIGGRNLIIASAIKNATYLVDTTGVEGRTDTHSTTDFIPVTANTDYTFSELSVGLTQVRIVFYSSYKAYISGKLYPYQQGKVIKTTSPSGASFVRLSGDNRSFLSNLPTWKLERGSKATDWSPSPEDIDKALTSNAAAITAESKARADANTASAAIVTGLQTTVNGHTSSINETKTSLNGISAKWSMETNVNGKVSGIYQHSTGKRSGLDIITDSFSVSDGTSSYKPFVIEGGVVKVGVPLVANSLITAPTISGGTIMAGTFQGGQIAIGNETVTNNGVITKANFMVTSDGKVTISSSTTGKRLVITDQLISVYDANNKLRVRLGLW